MLSRVSFALGQLWKERGVRDVKATHFITAGVFLLPLIALAFSSAPVMLSLVLYANLYALALYDWHSFRLPNMLNASLLITGFMATYAIGGDMVSHLIGAVAGFAFVVFLDMAYRRLRGRAGIGMGDAKFLAGAGAWAGWVGLPPTLFIASIVGLGTILIKSIAGKRHESAEPLPFGPYLCLGLWLTWLYFNRIDM